MSGYRPNLACVKTLRSVRRSNEEKKAFFFFRTDCSTARRPRSVLCCDILLNRTLRPRSIGPYTTLNPPSIDFQLTSLYQHKRTRQGGRGRWPPILEKFSKNVSKQWTSRRAAPYIFSSRTLMFISTYGCLVNVLDLLQVSLLSSQDIEEKQGDITPHFALPSHPSISLALTFCNLKYMLTRERDL